MHFKSNLTQATVLVAWCHFFWFVTFQICCALLRLNTFSTRRSHPSAAVSFVSPLIFLFYFRNMFFLLVFCVKCCRRLYNIDFTTNDPKSTLAIKKSIPFRKNLRSYSILIIMNMWSKRVNLDFIWFCTKPSLLMYFSSSCIRVVPIGTFSRFGFQSHCHYCQMYDT